MLEIVDGVIDAPTVMVMFLITNSLSFILGIVLEKNLNDLDPPPSTKK